MGFKEFQKLISRKMKVRDEYVEEGLIPIGYRTYPGKYYASDEVVTIPQTFGSDSILIIGTPRSGKTVIAKNIAYWDAEKFNRTLVSIDSEGTEWHLCQYPNQNTNGIFQKVFGHQGAGINNLKSFSPSFSTYEKNKEDEEYTFEPNDLSIRDWASLDIDRAYIISEAIRKGNDDLEKLKNYIKSLPKNKQEAEDAGLDFHIHSQIHNKMIQKLYYLENDGFFKKKANKLNKEVLFELLNKKFNLNFNFFGSEQYARIYAGTILNHIYNLRREKRIKAPVIYVEEADNLCPSKGNDVPSKDMLIKAIRRGGKYGWKVVTITQRLSSIHQDVAQFSKNFIIGGNLTASDIRLLKDLVHPDCIRAIQNLRFDPNRNIREFVLIGPDKRYYTTFRAFNCPVATFEEERDYV